MNMAPPEMRDRYFGEVFDLINAESRNKRLRLQLENQVFLLHVKKLKKAKEGMGNFVSKRPALPTHKELNDLEATMKLIQKMIKSCAMYQ